jgi:hypothetical protein
MAGSAHPVCEPAHKRKIFSLAVLMRDGHSAGADSSQATQRYSGVGSKGLAGAQFGMLSLAER